MLTLKLLFYVPDIGQFWQYIVCTAKLAYVPVRIIGTLEYVVKTQLILKNHFTPLWFDKNATGFATNI